MSLARLALVLALCASSLACRDRAQPAAPQVDPAPSSSSSLDATARPDASDEARADRSIDRERDGDSSRDTSLWFSPWRYRTDGGFEFDMNPSALVGTEGRLNDARTRITPATVTGRSGRAPAMRAVRDELRRQLSSSSSFVAQGAFNAVGDGRFVAVVQRTDRAFPDSPTLLVVVASELDGRAQLENVAELPTDGVFQSPNPECQLTVMGRELRDIDRDGELELSIAVHYCTQPVCPTGYTEIAYLAVYDLTPSPRLAVMVERAIHPESDVLPKRTRRTRWSDVNSDGHPDLVIDGEDCQFVADPRQLEGASASTLGCRSLEDSICCVDRSEVVLYDPGSDLWHPGGNGATPVVYSPCSGGGP